MSLKEIWTDKVNGQDVVDAEDINAIADAIIELEENGGGGNFMPSADQIETVMNVIQSDDAFIVYDKPQETMAKLTWEMLKSAISSAFEGNIYAAGVMDPKSEYTAVLPELEDDTVLLTEATLAAAVETALAEAKASGEFDGADGEDGSVWYFIGQIVENESINMYFPDAKNGDYCLNISEWDVYHAENGKWKQIGNIKGATPVKGKDYFTEADKEEIVGELADAAPVRSVNGKTGAIQLGASDVGARPSTWTPTYADLTGTPTIPSKTSELTNDKGFLTAIPSEYVTETELDSAIGAALSGVHVAIPEAIHIAVGKEFKMYYKNVISRGDCRLWVASTSGITVKRYADYLSITAAEATTKNVKWKIYDNLFNVVAEGTMAVIATAESAKTAKALVIGDSTVTQSNAISQKLLDCFSGSGGSLTLLGTRGTSPALHEGRAGWKAADYCTKASDSSYSNPFYNNGFDFSYYMSQQGYAGVDIVVIQLGINDIFSMTYENFTSTATAGYIQQMVDSVIAYNSGIKVIVNLLSVPNGDGISFADAYKTSQIDFVNLVNSIRMSKALIEKFTDSAYVTVSPNNCVLDTENDINDGVHPNSTGYAKLGQAIYETINGIYEGSSDENESGALWDLNTRSGVAHNGGIAAATAREMKIDHYYYLDGYTGTTQYPNNYTLTDYLATENTLEFTVGVVDGVSASGLSAFGISVPLALEVGKTYTFTAQAASGNSGVRLVTYTANGDNWVYSSNEPICYNSTTLCSITITPESGKGYAINFSQKSAGVGTKNVFTSISLTEN